MGVRVIDPHTDDPVLARLSRRSTHFAQQARLPPTCRKWAFIDPPKSTPLPPAPPKDALFWQSPRPFAENVPKRIEGVLAHEITHISNGDMVTMTLLQGVVNAFVMSLPRLALALSGSRGGNREQVSRGSYMLWVILFEILFMVLGSLVIAAYSRWREFRADAGGAELAGKGNMIAALQSLKALQERRDPRAEQPSFRCDEDFWPSKVAFDVAFRVASSSGRKDCAPGRLIFSIENLYTP